MPDKKTTILVADDEESVSRVVSKMLSNAYLVLEAKDGEKAVQIARASKQDVILMDMFMPRMDGCTACFELKRYEMTSEIPVVAATGKGRQLQEKLVLAMGAKGYLSKPFTRMDIFVPHVGHVPWVGGLPFFIVIVLGAFISLLVWHLTLTPSCFLLNNPACKPRFERRRSLR
jgi:CheY-like chemotaxis protein